MDRAVEFSDSFVSCAAVLLVSGFCYKLTPGPSNALQLIPAIIYALHPVTALAGVSVDSRLLENVLLVVAIASAEAGIVFPVVFCVLSLIYSSCVQGVCIGLVCVVWPLRQQAVTASCDSPVHAKSVGRKAQLALSGLAATASWYWAYLGNFDPQAALRTLQVHPASPVPEMSTTWYLFSEAFARYMPYFTVAAWAHPLLYPLPLAVRLQRRPIIAAIAVVALAGLLDPSGGYTLTRLPLATALALTQPDVIAEMRGVLFWMGLQAFSLAVSPLMKRLWLVDRIGNANFMFNQHLIFTLASGALVAEFVAAALRVERKRGAAFKTAQSGS